jgi:hypothetical protein
MPTARTLTPSMTGRVKFATSTAPCPPLADLVSNPTPPGQIPRELASRVLRSPCPRPCPSGSSGSLCCFYGASGFFSVASLVGLSVFFLSFESEASAVPAGFFSVASLVGLSVFFLSIESEG